MFLFRLLFRSGGGTSGVVLINFDLKVVLIGDLIGHRLKGVDGGFGGDGCASAFLDLFELFIDSGYSLINGLDLMLFSL